MTFGVNEYHLGLGLLVTSNEGPVLYPAFPTRPAPRVVPQGIRPNINRKKTTSSARDHCTPPYDRASTKYTAQYTRKSRPHARSRLITGALLTRTGFWWYEI